MVFSGLTVDEKFGLLGAIWSQNSVKTHKSTSFSHQKIRKYFVCLGVKMKCFYAFWHYFELLNRLL